MIYSKVANLHLFSRLYFVGPEKPFLHRTNWKTINLPDINFLQSNHDSTKGTTPPPYPIEPFSQILIPNLVIINLYRQLRRLSRRVRQRPEKEARRNNRLVDPRPVSSKSPQIPRPGETKRRNIGHASIERERERNNADLLQGIG